MRTVYPIIIIIFVWISCQDPKERLDKDIKNQEKELFSDPMWINNKKGATDLMQKYILFAGKYTDDKRAPLYIFKAAEIANGMGAFQDAIRYFEKIYMEYPNDSIASVSLFYEGVIYETQLKNYEKAKKIYRDFLAKYPQHELVGSARFSLETLGKSDEEVLKVLEQRQKDKVLN